MLLFVCKIAAGLISGRVTETMPSSDSWQYHNEAQVEYQMLFQNPAAYFTNIFNSGYNDKYAGIFKGKKSYWNDLKTNLMVKFVSVLHIFSGGNYYVNVVLFNFLVFLGNIALFRTLTLNYNQSIKLLIIPVFLLPSLLLFGSAIHKEGLIFAALGFIFYIYQRLLQQKRITIKKAMVLFFCVLLVYLLRNYVIIMLLPVLCAWAIAVVKKYNPFITFLVVYTMFFMLFFNVHHIIPAINPPAMIAQKQADFFELEKARSQIYLPLLSGSFKSFVSNFPAAFFNVTARPTVMDYKFSPTLIAFALEMIFYQLLFFFFIFFRKKQLEINVFFIAGLFFSISMLLLIGYIVPVIWAIIRYRSIYLPFLIVPIFTQLNWEKLAYCLRYKK